MVEYGGTVRESTGLGGGGGGGSMDVGGQVLDALRDVVERIGALPPEVLLLLVLAAVIGFAVLARA